MILSGGSGTRLWPLSRASKPKQFLSFGSSRSLFQNTLRRCQGEGFDPRPIVVGAYNHRFLLAEDLLHAGVAADILLEPLPRNSCAAIAAGCLHAIKRSTDAMVLVLAADHHIPDARAFGEAVADAAGDAKNGYLVTFGVRPSFAATGYGYVQPGDPLKCAFRVKRFVEKPKRADAENYVARGYLWNSGNFLFRADAFLAQLSELQPDILGAVNAAMVGAKSDLDFLRLDATAFAEAPSISVDYAIMEKTDKAAVLPVEYAWSDIGSWDAVADVVDQDVMGNAVIGEAEIIDSHDSIVHSETKLTTLIGVDGMVVVATRDAVLVAPKTRAEEVKALVEQMHRHGRKEATEALKMFRPWGNYERLDIGDGYQVKRIVVKPGGVLSLQKHRHRSEHWVVVQGIAEVTIGSSVMRLEPNHSVYVPLGSVHRLANRGNEPVVLIEVQTGSYLGEDDIIRLEDNYNRTKSGETS
ncbi:mannose-1-phosphate guanylyltransferase/mannose-6-phosphate isomerase [Mesorhizobium sp. 10J20-29]